MPQFHILGFKKFKKYIGVTLVFSKTSLMTAMASRWTYILAVFAKVLRMVLVIVFFQAIFLNVQSFAGWEFQEILLLTAVYLSIESIFIITFHRNLAYWFPEMLYKGEFDFALIKPVSPLYYVSFRIIDWFDVLSTVPVIGLWWYVLTQFSWSFDFVSVMLFAVYVLVGILFYYGFLLFLASTAFWVINARGVGRMLEKIFSAARYPATSFRGFPRVIFLYIIPVAFFGTLPAQILLQQASAYYMIFALVLALCVFFGSLAFWRFALRHYSSVSS